VLAHQVANPVGATHVVGLWLLRARRRSRGVVSRAVIRRSVRGRHPLRRRVAGTNRAPQRLVREQVPRVQVRDPDLNRCVSHGHVFTTCHRSFALTAALKTARHPAIPERRCTAGSGSAAALPTLVGVSLSQPCPGRRRAPTWAPWPSSERFTGPATPSTPCSTRSSPSTWRSSWRRWRRPATARACHSPVVSSGRNLSGCLSTGIT
jgi:hypothetical protein